MTLRESIVETVLGFVGTAFHHQGRVPGVGMDCAGVPVVAMWMLGLKPRTWDVTGYPRIPDGLALKGYCDAELEPISRDEMRYGDVILVAWQGGPPQHLGVLVPYRHGGLSMVHAESLRHNQVIETRLEFSRAMRFVAAYRMPGVS